MRWDWDNKKRVRIKVVENRRHDKKTVSKKGQEEHVMSRRGWDEKSLTYSYALSRELNSQQLCTVELAHPSWHSYQTFGVH